MRVGLSRPSPKRRAARRSPRARRKALLLLSFGLPPCAQAVETPWTPLAADALSAADGYQQSGDWDQAITHYRRALQISPMPPAFQRYVIYNNLGWSMYHMGDWGKAEEHYKHALRASPQPPPTDHAYINLATLHKAENRIKPTIKAYRAAVALTHQSPTWAQLGWALMQDYQLDEATQTLHDALAYRGDDAPAAQECHNYLGVLYSYKRQWTQASQHFVRAADLGLPTNGTGCKAGRWQLAEGWLHPSAKGVTAHPLPLEAVLSAIDSAATQAQRPPTLTLSLTLSLTFTLALTRTLTLTLALTLTPTFTLTFTLALSLPAQAQRRGGRSSDAAQLCSRAQATATFEDRHAGSNYSNSVEAGDYKLVELKDVYLDGKHPSSLYQASYYG